jgi:hypothetical protein
MHGCLSSKEEPVITRPSLIALLSLFPIAALTAQDIDPGQANPLAINGSISSDTTWQGTVLIEGTSVIQAGVTVTVLPGTKVMFKHYRGYREPDKRLALRVQGALIAQGTAQNPIYFTSDAPDPQNGDWSMLRLFPSTLESSFRYVVFECAQHGLNVWNEDVELAHCVFRWNNWEGIYFESYCTATLDSCLIVENGYNGLAAEQYNTLLLRYCNVKRSGTSGVHADATSITVQDSWIVENGAHGLSVDDNGSMTSLGVIIANNRGWGIGVGEGTNTVTIGNTVFSNNISGPVGGPYSTVSYPYDPPTMVSVGFQPDTSYALGYVPGDSLLDGYMYIYPDDETREVDAKIGAGLGLTWSVAWDGSALWTATLSGKISKLNPTTGAVLKQFDAPGSQPWGMTFDGKSLWLVDFAEKRISQIDTASGFELKTFPTPDTVGGCKGVAWDGEHLNILGWTTSTIYKVDTIGTLVGTITLAQGGMGGIAWDGSYFWVSGRKILKYDTLGAVVGWIYPCSEGTWDLEWDGTHLWMTQRTNENWRDAKLYRVRVLDDHSPPISMFVKPGGNDLLNGLSGSTAKRTIQAAIDVAPTNARVLIAGGTYDENLILQSRTITIEGGYDSIQWMRDPALYPVVLTGGGRGPVIKITSGGVSFEDLIIRDGASGPQGGGGLDITGGNTQLDRCTITQNSATGQNEWGGGGAALLDGTISLVECSVTNNQSLGGAGGLRLGAGSRFTITRTVIAGNEGRPGVHINDASGLFVNCSVADNADGGYLFNTPSDTVSITNSILWNNGPYDVSGNMPIISYSNSQGGVAGTGNISSDPHFRNSVDRDYHLEAESPCIDRGDPASPLDPDGTRADMGAFFFDQTVVGVEESLDDNVRITFGLMQNYPNPFNPRTRISYSIPQWGSTSLDVFDLLGRHVATLVNEDKPAGDYTVEWEATGLPTGIYFYRLAAGSHVEIRKMTFIK